MFNTKIKQRSSGRRGWLLLLFIVWASTAEAGISFINVSGASNDASGTTMALPAVSHTSGNFLAVLVKYEGASTTVSVSDTAGNAYTGLTQYDHSNNDLHARIFYAKNITGNASNVVTVTWSAARTFRKAAVQQYSGVVTASPFDKENSGEGASGTSMSTGNVTTTQANELFVAIAGEYSSQSNYTAGTGWTRRVDFTLDIGSGGGATEDKIVSSIGTYNATMTQPNSAEWLMAMATFKGTGTPIAWWKLDDGSGTNATDSSGNSYSGTLTNGPTWTTGRYSNALNFDGVDDYVNFGDIDAVDGLTAITVSLWIKAANTNSAATETHLIDKSACNGLSDNGAFEFLAAGNIAHKAMFGVIPAGGSPQIFVSAEGSTTIDDTKWHHLVGVYDGSNVSLYVDGKSEASTSLSSVALASTTYNVEIGGNCNGHGGFYWNGLIDDVRIYNRALTPAEIRKLFQGGNAIRWSLD